MNKKYEVIVIGAGPCGLFTAINCKKKTLLIDANKEIGGKIKVSGGGRCNISNNKEIEPFMKAIHKNSKFLYPALNNFSAIEVIEYFTKNGIMLKEEEENKMFPKSNDANEFIHYFEEQIKDIEVRLEYLANNVKYENGKYIINNEYECEFLVIATGGVTYKHISHGYVMNKILEDLDINITDLSVASSPLVVTDEVISSKVLQGVSLRKPTINLYVNKKKKKTINKDIIITHFGLSGPGSLDLSCYIKEQLDKNKSVEVEIILRDDIPKKIIPYLDEHNSIKFKISDVKGFNTAFITNGGVSLKELLPQTLETRKYPNLYLGGELLDIHAITGGYNITMAMSMGKLIADTINQK